MARYEGSPADKKQDRKTAKKRGESLKAYEKSAYDRKADGAGQRKLDKKSARKK